MTRNCGTRIVRALSAVSGALAGLATRAAAQGPAIDREMQRSMARADRSLERLAVVFAEVGALWLWVLGSVLGYFVVAVIASVLDRRMLGLRGLGPVARYVLHGARTFVRLVRDRRTPGLARGVLVLGLLYWLLPYDLLMDWSYFTPLEGEWMGFVDDILVAVLAAKAFLFLCPDALVAQHALAVERRDRPVSRSGRAAAGRG